MGLARFGDYLDRLDGAVAVNAGFLVGHSTVRRVVMGDAATRDAATPEQLGRDGPRSLHAVAGRGRARLLVVARRGPHRRRRQTRAVRAARVRRVRRARRARSATTPGTTLEFIPTVGPIPDERMELMADMSLAADRPLNWNLLGSLASDRDLRAAAPGVRRRGGAGRARRRAHAAGHDAHAGESHVLETLPGWRTCLARRRRPPGRRRRPRERGRACGPAPTKVAEQALGVLSDFNLMEVADAGVDAWVGRRLAEVAAARAAPTSSTCSSTSCCPSR